MIENDMNALIPKDYVQNDTERLNIYRRLYELKSIDEVKTISDELKDRFGEYLDDVENLLRIIKIKIIATEMGIEKITIRNKDLSMYFPQDKDHKIFQSEFFNKLIEIISSDKSRKYNIAPDKERLIIKIILESNADEERLSEMEEIFKHQS